MINESKYLGIPIDKTSSWKEHINIIALKISRGIEICKEVRPSQYSKNHVQKHSRAIFTILLHGMGMLH